MFYRDSLYNPNTMKHNFHGDGAIRSMVDDILQVNKAKHNTLSGHILIWINLSVKQLTFQRNLDPSIGTSSFISRSTFYYSINGSVLYH